MRISLDRIFVILPDLDRIRIFKHFGFGSDLDLSKSYEVYTTVEFAYIQRWS